MSNNTTPTPTTTTKVPNLNQQEEIDIFKSLKTNTKDKTPPTLKGEQKTKLSTLDTKSKMIRYLSKEGYTNHQISKILNIRYQHVYNVLHQILKS